MGNYKEASRVGQEIILTNLKNTMKEQKVTQQEVAETLEVSRTTVIRWFKMETPMPLGSYLEICGLLKLKETKLILSGVSKNTSLKEMLVDFGNVVKNSEGKELELLADAYIGYDRIKDE